MSEQSNKTSEQRITELEAASAVQSLVIGELADLLNKLSRTVVALAERVTGQPIPEPEVFVTTHDGRRVSSLDIPRDGSGLPTEDWLVQNCGCSTHTAARELAARQREGE